MKSLLRVSLLPLCLVFSICSARAGSQEDAAATSAQAHPADLFADGTFSQWQRANGQEVDTGWSIVEGVIHRSGDRPGNIVTRAEYQDFELTFEWKISEGGNSGVKYRVKNGLGLEYQVLDDTQHKDAKNPTHRTASLYDLVAAPDDKPVNPVGEWNQARVVARGGHLEHWLNGAGVVLIDQTSPDWAKRFANSKYRSQADFGVGAGQILLQDHGDEVWYRNVRIKPLTK